MAKAIALTKRITADPADVLRLAIVCTCAIALIAAGQGLPF